MSKINHHPDTATLIEFSAGVLPPAVAICVSAHLHYCDDCKKKVAQLTDLGAVLFDKITPINLEQDFSTLMQHIDSLPETTIQINTETIASSTSRSSLPAALNKITNSNLDSLDWRKINKNFRYSELNIGDPLRETSLFNIKSGGNIPRHRHMGDEITVVLKGGFSDQDDHYEVGDFIVRTRGEIHTPVATQDKDCLCLSTLDEPIQITNWFYRLLIPLIRG